METDRFDRLTRALASAPSRRGLVRLFATAPLATGLLAAVAWDEASGQKKPKRCRPKCKNCEKCRQSKCKPNKKKDRKPCAGSKVCEGGRCVPERCGNGGCCRVFLTSVTGKSGLALGGLAGADAICQQLAEDAGLPGAYLAWLSAGTDSPANRFTKRGKAGPYLLVPNAGDGGNLPPTVAVSFADLTSCKSGTGECLQHAIDRVEDGTVLTGVGIPVWTGTEPDGTPAADTCSGWTDGGIIGVVGSGTDVDDTWTNAASNGCAGEFALYCFEQA